MGLCSVLFSKERKNKNIRYLEHSFGISMNEFAVFECIMSRVILCLDTE